MLPQHGHAGFQFILREFLGAAQNNGAGALHLVVEEFAEVLHIELAFGSVHYGDKAVQFQGSILLHTLYGTDYVRKLTYAGRLDQNTVRMKLIQHLF